MSPLGRISVYIPLDMQQALENWAASENRSISNLAATIIINAIKEHENQENPSPNKGKGNEK